MGKLSRRGHVINSALESLEQRMLFSAGLLDTTFNDTGKQTANYGGSTQDGISVAFQADHKAIVVGDVQLADKDAFIARFNEDGSPDTSYGTSGRTILDLGQDEIATDVAIQSDGKAVVCGITGNISGFQGNFFVARFNTDGTLDTTFDAHGSVPGVKQVDFGGLDGASGITITPSGRIIVVGASASGSLAGGGIAVAFLKPDGTLDTSVGNGVGHTLTSPGVGTVEGATDVVQGPNGKFFISGFSTDITTSGNSQFMVAEFNANGSLDTSFGNNGRAFANFGSRPVQLAMGIAYDAQTGKIAAAGTYADGLVDVPPGLAASVTGSPAQNADIAVAQFDATTGALDPSFNNTGMETTTINVGGPNGIASATGVLYMPNGEIVAGGGFENPTQNNNSDFVATRYTTSGSLDPNFGSNGITIVDFDQNSDGAFGMRLQGWDNKVYEVGHTKSNAVTGSVALVRLSGDGTPAAPVLTVADASVAEGNSGTTTLTFTASLSYASSSNVSVNFATADGTATVADNDYTATNGTLTFAPGETTKTITVNVTGDTKVEDDETLKLNLSSASGATLSSNQATGTIVNDDAGTGAELSLGTPTIKVPKVIIGGAKNATGTATIVITNTGSSTYKGTINLAVYGSTDTTLDTAVDASLGSVSRKNVTLAPGKTVKLTVKLRFPSVDEDTDLNLIAAATATGLTDTSTSIAPTTVHVAQPTISLVGSSTPGTPITAASGKKITFKVPLTNTGNVPALGTGAFTIEILSDDEPVFYFFDKPPTSGNITDATKSAKLSIQPGKTAKLSFKLTLPPASGGTTTSLAAGNYTLVAILKSTTTNPANSTNGTTVATVPLTITA